MKLVGNVYEARTAETHSNILMVEGIATERKNHHRQEPH
jgi:hypothetical protein